MNDIRLKTAENDIIPVKVDILRQSRLLTSIINISERTSDTEPIHIEKILEWCEHHKDDIIPDLHQDLTDFNFDSTVDSWDANFLLVDQSTLYEILNAANFLDIPGLLDTCCKTIANMIKGKSTEEMRQILNIQNDFTPEEEEMLRRENQWIETVFKDKETLSEIDNASNRLI